MTSQEEINALNRASADREAREDWAKEERRVEIIAEERFGSRPARPLYFRDNAKEDLLAEIIRENVEASQAKISYNE